MDEEYVQEHILTGGIVAPVGGKKIGRPATLAPICCGAQHERLAAEGVYLLPTTATDETSINISGVARPDTVTSVLAGNSFLKISLRISTNLSP
jgi:hypothetical protein